MRFKIYILGLILLTSTVAADVKIMPVANVSILGGQYWVSGSVPTSMGGNVDLFFSPVINFSPKIALLPIYTGTYVGTKDVRELIGGGTLTQETLDHSLSLKFTDKLSEQWKIKGRIGYKLEYLKETKDETWGDGLFDYNKIIMGMELERNLETTNSRIGLDYYVMHYPNYKSLVTENGFETAIDTVTYSEISNQAGIDVLDYSAISAFFERSKKFSKDIVGTAHYDISIKNFKDQKIVQNTGEFSSALRKDLVHYLTLGIDIGSPKAMFGLTDGIQYYDSNQNSFDTANSKFISGYYNYFQNAVMPSLCFALGNQEKPVKLSLFWDISWRLYKERLSQSADAAYNSDKISQLVNTTGLNLLYPIGGNLSAKLSANYRDSASNMHYEKNYKYNYYTFNYFIGINWEL